MSKKYYWIKLHTDFFEQETIDFLMSQKDGANYIVLYEMLCTRTANTDGLLATTMGEMLIPYDVDKIVRDCKYFTKDTVVVALELYKKLGLVYLDENGILKITNYEKMVGSETEYALKMRKYRKRHSLTYSENNDNKRKKI